jgi:hypothetical protein
MASRHPGSDDRDRGRSALKQKELRTSNPSIICIRITGRAERLREKKKKEEGLRNFTKGKPENHQIRFF